MRDFAYSTAQCGAVVSLLEQRLPSFDNAKLRHPKVALHYFKFSKEGKNR